MQSPIIQQRYISVMLSISMMITNQVSKNTGNRDIFLNIQEFTGQSKIQEIQYGQNIRNETEHFHSIKTTDL